MSTKTAGVSVIESSIIRCNSCSERTGSRSYSSCAIHRAKDADAGMAALEAFAVGPWGWRYPAIAFNPHRLSKGGESRRNLRHRSRPDCGALALRQQFFVPARELVGAM
jgi:hypothetical protein